MLQTPLLSPELLNLLGRKPRLLIVDDQALNIQGLHRVFADECQVFMATAGEQALSLCAQKQPDLVLLDVEMPGMDGYQICARIKQDPLTRETPVVFVTAHQDVESETRCLEGGGSDFIAKPFNPAVVRARVRNQLQLKLQADLLRELAFIDGLTGLYNRRYFDERLAAELQRARRNGSSLALMMIDVDHFKRYNDRYGHQRGDDCLRAVAQALRRLIKRPADAAFRYGGEEFVCLLPETDAAGAASVARQLEEGLAQLNLPHEDGEAVGRVTVSQGIVVGSPSRTDEPADLLARADTELYRAKQTGRNRFCLLELASIAGQGQRSEPVDTLASAPIQSA